MWYRRVFKEQSSLVESEEHEGSADQDMLAILKEHCTRTRLCYMQVVNWCQYGWYMVVIWRYRLFLKSQ